MATPGSVERERKLGAPPGFVIPDLSDVAEGVVAVPMPRQELEATYYDTRDLRLARSGISVRFRTGEAKKGKWTVKLPSGAAGPSLARREIDVAAPGRIVPDEVASLVRATVRGAMLAPVGVLRTERRRVELRSRDEAALIEVADDEVSVVDRGRVAQRFREVEVEVVDPGAGALADDVAGALVAAGATADVDQTPKIVRALGPRATEAPDVVPPALDAASTVEVVVRAAIAAAFVRLVRHDPGVRLGGDPEDVHQARVAARRLRSDLRTFAPLLDTKRSRRLRDELQWVGAELGRVRDADVLLERLRAQAAALPARDARPATKLLRRLEAQEAEARAALLEALDSARYVRVLDAIAAAAARPPLGTDIDGGLPAREALPGLVRRPWKHLADAVDALGDAPADAALHEVRIRAKRARYAAEAAAPVVGKPAAKFAKVVAGVQSVLRDLQDAVVAEDWLRTAAKRAPADQALVAGQLVAVQQAAMSACRDGFPAAWAAVVDRKLASWLR